MLFAESAQELRQRAEGAIDAAHAALASELSVSEADRQDPAPPTRDDAIWMAAVVGALIAVAIVANYRADLVSFGKPWRDTQLSPATLAQHLPAPMQDAEHPPAITPPRGKAVAAAWAPGQNETRNP